MLFQDGTAVLIFIIENHNKRPAVLIEPDDPNDVAP